MTYLTKFFSLLILISFSYSASAQLSRAEKKKIKAEIKTYKKNPEKWIKLKKRHAKEVSDLEDEVAELKAQLRDQKEFNQSLQVSLDSMNVRYNNLLADYQGMKDKNSVDLPSGTVYQVQMGYYQYLDLRSFNSTLKAVKAEEVDGSKRYIIGYFASLNDAWQFNNDLKLLGIKDAFVTQYVNGVRIMDFDALRELGGGLEVVPAEGF